MQCALKRLFRRFFSYRAFNFLQTDTFCYCHPQKFPPQCFNTISFCERRSLPQTEREGALKKA